MPRRRLRQAEARARPLAAPGYRPETLNVLFGTRRRDHPDRLWHKLCGDGHGRVFASWAAMLHGYRLDPDQEILCWALENGDFAVQSRCHRVLGSVFDMVGDSAMALEHAVAANNLLADSEEPLMRAAVRLCLADALGCAGSHDEAEIRYGEALALVSDDDETTIRYVILNNLAFNCFSAHNPTQALAVVERLLTVSKQNGRPVEMHARDTVGPIYLTVGRGIEAVQVLLPAMDAIPADSNPDDVAMCLVAPAEVFRAQGQPDEGNRPSTGARWCAGSTS